MSGDTRSDDNGSANAGARTDGDDPTDGTGGSRSLTIALPDGSESVSDAIVTHREMLIDPQDHGIATAEDVTHLSEALESLAEDVEAATDRREEERSQVEHLQSVVDRQQRQIAELRSTVDSLVEILGTEVEWGQFDGD